VCLLFCLNNCIHVLKYVVRCMLNYGPDTPWLFICMGVLNFILVGGMLQFGIRAFGSNIWLVWARINVNLVEICCYRFWICDGFGENCETRVKSPNL
jgi:hypothetical protein